MVEVVCLSSLCRLNLNITKPPGPRHFHPISCALVFERAHGGQLYLHCEGQVFIASPPQRSGHLIAKAGK